MYSPNASHLLRPVARYYCLGGNRHLVGQDFCFYYRFLKFVSGHKKFMGAMPPNASMCLRAWIYSPYQTFYTDIFLQQIGSLLWLCVEDYWSLQVWSRHCRSAQKWNNHASSSPNTLKCDEHSIIWKTKPYSNSVQTAHIWRLIHLAVELVFIFSFRFFVSNCFFQNL